MNFTQAGNKRRRTSQSQGVQRRISRFLDLEADVSGEDDGTPDKDDEDDIENFDPNDGEKDAHQDVEMVQHSRLLRELGEQSSKTFWNDFLTRAQSRSGGTRIPTPDGDTDEEDLTTKDGDALWEVGCTPGSEEVAIFKILLRATHPTMPHSVGKAAFGRSSIPGRIFLEASTREDASQMVLGIPELKVTQISPVSQEFWFRLLKTDSKVFRPRSQKWVRLCGCRRLGKRYKGDIALVSWVGRSGLIEVVFVPRISQIGREKQIHEFHPPCLLTMEQLQEVRKIGTLMLDDEAILIPQGSAYTLDGFQMLYDVDLGSYLPIEALPTLEELQIFTKCRTLLPSTYTHTQNLIAQQQICLGHRVKVLSGEFQELVRTVEEVSQGSISVFLPSQDFLYKTMTCNLRKEFLIGDEVSVITGDHSGKNGWVTQVESTHVTVCNALEFMEICVPIVFVEFDSKPLITALHPRKRHQTDSQPMQDNPNRIYHNKQIIVTGSQHYKAYRGIIKDTMPQGLAYVELAINPPKVVALNLDTLCYWSKGIQEKLTAKKNPLSSEMPTLTAPNTHPPAPAPPSTPMPDCLEYADLSPAWNPQALSPLPNVFAWLSDPIFHMIRIKFAEHADLGVGIQPNPRILEFRSLVDLQTAKVRDGMRSWLIPLSRLMTFKPMMAGDWVVPISGQYQGKIYRIRSYGDQHCTVRENGCRLRKNEADLSIPTSELVQVFPPS